MEEFIKIGSKFNNIKDYEEWKIILRTFSRDILSFFSNICFEENMYINLDTLTCSPDCDKFNNILHCDNLGIMYVFLYSNEKEYYHHTALFIDNNKKEIEYFDSAGDDEGITILETFSNLSDWKIIRVDTFCDRLQTPQRKTKDNYCVFWSYLYTYLYIMYKNSKKIWDNFNSLTNTQLEQLIRGFILFLIETFMSSEIRPISKNIDDSILMSRVKYITKSNIKDVHKMEDILYIYMDKGHL